MSKYFIIRISEYCKSPGDCFRHEKGAFYHKCTLCLPCQPIDRAVEVVEVVGTKGKRFKVKNEGEETKI